MTRKVKCEECEWHGLVGDLLHAKNPFDAGDTLDFCPECKSCGNIIYACDEAECWADVTCGTPTQGGYRSTCGKHRPNVKIRG
mgnify:CR=1 FL=1